ncbi:glycoside hydrolase domain-containing protein [Oceanobacillus halotolerans]|uniref:glycoside hydrolase domain-containing protein n=1 Tax=Oceanobacillus halotolerans TaxID=2663380 RepID=UPI0013DACF41|nr:glycoside hydrolase domain-containing protein [Oceanobacillus halotolerans]
MKRYQIWSLIGLAIVIAIPFLLNVFFFDDSSSDNGNGNGNGSNGNGNGNGNGDEIHWGVDSASYTDDNMYQCVVDNFGEPEVWGRYLGDREGVSQGLDTDEVDRLHNQDVQILVIYNHANDVTGYDNGVSHAEEAISYAEDLNISDGVALFLDVEPSYPVNAEFLEGWYDTLSDSPYEPGVYGVFDESSSDLLNAFNGMDQQKQENTVVWTAYPQEGITTKDNAPEFNPQGPDNAMVYGWQYGLEAEACNIDTNLFTGDMLDYLW